MPLRVLIVDDHEVFREGLKSLLVSRKLEIAGEANNGHDALKLARRLEPDVAIVDIGLPGLNGLETVKGFARDSPRTRAIVLTVHAEDSYVLEALRAGAKGYVLKTQAFADLTHAIETVMKGSVYLSPGISRVLVDASLGRTGPPEDPLSAREHEVLQLVAEGHTNKEIAHRLSISIKTVETHRSAIMRKLDLHDVASLVRYAIRRGMIEA
jgi:DNA-binding NarL/FixJ family response regulator